jgi:hypothetical protein
MIWQLLCNENIALKTFPPPKDNLNVLHAQIKDTWHHKNIDFKVIKIKYMLGENGVVICSPNENINFL